MEKIKSIIFAFVFYLIFILVKGVTFLFLIIRIKCWFPRKKESIIFVENLPVENAGYQYRARKWAEIFEENKLNAKVVTTIPDKERFNNLLKTRVYFYYLYSLIKRFLQVISLLRYETVIVRRELLQYNNYGNLFFEKFLLSFHSNVILDFDDDINLHETIKSERSLFGKILLENKNKFYDTLRLYKKFVVGSEYLKQLIIRENKGINPNAIAVIPTCVDYNRYPAKDYSKNKEKIVFGWVGTQGNLVYLDLIINALNEVNKKISVELNVISSGDYFHQNASFKIVNLRWSLGKEIEQLYQIDIGLMPLTDTPLERGKSGFKLIQYMGLGIVSVASAITVNNDIVKNNEDGFLVYNEQEWEEVIMKVVGQRLNFESIGKKAKESNNLSYTFDANKMKYLKFLKEI